MRTVERVACANNAAFVMNFSIQWLAADGTWKTSAWNSGNYACGSTIVSPPLTSPSVGVPPDALAVRPYVHAILGRSGDGTPVVQAAQNGSLVAYEVKGTTLDFSVSQVPVTWQNWGGNLVHALSGDDNYFLPTNLATLQEVVRSAVSAGATLRVSGQRHSQPPLVADDNRSPGQGPSKTWLVDLSCYRDLGPNQDQRIVLGPGPNQVQVNTGVREDELDAFLTAHNKMLRTVTAGGFFSIGGMTAVDVHGATIDEPIFAETASSFTLVGPDGQVTTVDASSPAFNGWAPLQFARVSFGALGIVTSVILEVLDRPWATTLQPSKQTYTLSDENAFVSKYKELLSTHSRIESFLNPYSNKYLALCWDVVAAPSTHTPNIITQVPDACTHEQHQEFGAPDEGFLLEQLAEAAAQQAQSGVLGRAAAEAVMNQAISVIEGMFDQATKVYSDLWLTKAARAIFMSYFVELPDLDTAGLSKAWQGLHAVTTRLQSSSHFLLAGPLEFRFVRGGNTALAGTYTTAPKSTFVNLDLIGFVPAEQAQQYPPALLQFFADIERAWVALGGMPHNGKMYGFYDPGVPGSATAPFNPAFLAALAQRRSARIQAFEAYRRTRDPGGVFCNGFVRALLGR